MAEISESLEMGRPQSVVSGLALGQAGRRLALWAPAKEKWCAGMLRYIV